MWYQRVYKISGIFFIFNCAMAQKPGKGNYVIYLNSFLEFLSIARQNKWHFWNPETKLDEISMFRKENDFQNLTFLIWTLPDLGSNVKMSVTIEFYLPNESWTINMCNTTLVLYFHMMTSFDLTLTSTCI